MWLAPVQVNILNVTDRQSDYCLELQKKLKSQGIRVHFDNRNEKLGYKIRESQLQKIPYMIIIGDKEMEDQKVSVRVPTGEMTEPMTIDDFITAVVDEVSEKSLKPKLSGTKKK